MVNGRRHAAFGLARGPGLQAVGPGAAHDNGRMLRDSSARWATGLVWAGVAAAAVAWGLPLLVRPTPVPAQALQPDLAVAAAADVSRVLGVDPPPPAPVEAPDEAPQASTRFTLLGVVAPRPAGGRGGVALIAVDGGTPKAFRVGSTVDADTVLQSVHPRGAALGPRNGPARVALELPPPAAAATGRLPLAAPSMNRPQGLQGPGSYGPSSPPAAQAAPAAEPEFQPNYVPNPPRPLPPPQQQSDDAEDPPQTSKGHDPRLI
jgi:general secretion pathway protein C